jgi:MinD-like ATPase involved in chromosome partitioning or flagellar assembly
MNIEAISKVVADGYDVSRLNSQFDALKKSLGLDLLVIDSHPGLNRETMLTTAVSDTLLIVIRPDRQDYHGTAVMLQVASRLQVPRVFMLANKVPRRLDRNAVRERIQSAMGYEMLAALPLEEEMACLGSEALFVQRFPDHALSLQIREVAERLFSGEGGQPL